MQVVIGSADRYFSQNMWELASENGFQCIRTYKLERVIKELKQPGRIAIIDMNWEPIQTLSVLRQLVNVGRICDNLILAIAPDQEEELKKLAKAARVTELFLRYDILGRFKDYMADQTLRQRAEKE